MAKIGYVPFTVANGASTGSKTDLGSTARLVGLQITGTWTAAFIAFKAFMPDTTTSTSPQNPLTDTGATWDFIRDDVGNIYTIGATGLTGNQYYALGSTTAKPLSLDVVRYIQIVSTSTSGTTATPTATNQGQLVKGYFITRDD